MGRPLLRAEAVRRLLIAAALCSAALWVLRVPCDAQGAGRIGHEAAATQAHSSRRQSARDLYESADFAGAAEAFKRELRDGAPSSSLLYNLGNACFKAGRLGEAILQYERALRLAPRDHDIQDNLALARLATVDRFLEPPRPWPLDALARLHRQLRTDEVAAIATVLFWCLCFAIAGRCAAVVPRWQRTAAVAGVVVTALLLPVTASLSVRLYDSAYVHEAIVVVQEAELRSGPGASFGSSVTLHEGAKVRMGERRGVWTRATTQAGVDGWARASEMEGI